MPKFATAGWILTVPIPCAAAAEVEDVVTHKEKNRVAQKRFRQRQKVTSDILPPAEAACQQDPGLPAQHHHGVCGHSSPRHKPGHRRPYKA